MLRSISIRIITSLMGDPHITFLCERDLRPLAFIYFHGNFLCPLHIGYLRNFIAIFIQRCFPGFIKFSFGYDTIHDIPILICLYGRGKDRINGAVLVHGKILHFTAGIINGILTVCNINGSRPFTVVCRCTCYPVKHCISRRTVRRNIKEHRIIGPVCI